jgi:acylphosphatase
MFLSQPMQVLQAHVLISGVVQGVGYRFTTERVAQQLSLKGWVRNLPDGRVEAVFEGTQEQIDQMLTWCHQGSAGARVTEVRVNYQEPEGHQSFDIRR